jgi:hypothetical protein
MRLSAERDLPHLQTCALTKWRSIKQSSTATELARALVTDLEAEAWKLEANFGGL